MVSVKVTLKGIPEVVAKLKLVPVQVQSRIRAVVADNLLALRDGVKSNIASMFRTSARMSNAVQTRMEEASNGDVSGVVFIDGKDIPYARIQEEGGRTPAHLILPKNASVLAFLSQSKFGFSGGQMVFAKVVHHPGSLIPEHPYMRFALARQTPEFKRGMMGIVDEIMRS